MTGNAIISAIAGYGYEDISDFLISALRNTSADIVLITPRLSSPLRQRLLSSPRVRIVEVNFQDEPWKMAIKRFAYARQLLTQLDASQALLCDARDVFFQADPFAEHSEGIVFAEEPKRICECPINTGWIREFFTAELARNIGENPVLCVGTILGPRNSLVDFLERFTASIETVIGARKEPAWGIDQACLNSLVWGGALSIPHTTAANHRGFALTLYHETQLHLNMHGKLVGINGEIIPVIHQQDRYPWLMEHLRHGLG